MASHTGLGTFKAHLALKGINVKNSVILEALREIPHYTMMLLRRHIKKFRHYQVDGSNIVAEADLGFFPPKNGYIGYILFIGN